jgi:uncharacterized protein (DUF1778 family)
MQNKQSSYSYEKSERLEARLSKDLKSMLQHAADLSGRSLTDFILSASKLEAGKVIRDHEMIVLTPDESKRFAQMLLNPPEPNKALQDLFKRHSDAIDNNIIQTE